MSNAILTVGCAREDIIIDMDDHHKPVFAKAPTPGIQDNTNTYHSAKQGSPHIGATNLAAARECSRNVKN